MHIVRSDKINGDTTVVSFAEMRGEMVMKSKRYDDEVEAVENVTVLLFTPEHGDDGNSILLVCPGVADFTIYSVPPVGRNHNRFA